MEPHIADPDPVPTDAEPERRASWFGRHIPLVSGAALLIVAVLLGVVIVVRQQTLLLGLDEEWAEEMTEIRGPVGDALALFFNYAGGTLIGALIIPLATVIALLAARRRWAALYFAIASAASAIGVQILKQLFGRARPEDMLVVSDFGSFPSGHVANAATVAVAFGVIFPVVWVWIAGAAWTVLMAVSRTYLGAHWFTDTIGGFLIGAGMALVIWGPFAQKLEQERLALHERRHPAA
ncbi:phosphatase PAP2 family protein [Leifsonia sp. YIM 134122]|uniref:Phosphatase PAP2 family protein n=1 Tax=Leifsonia stereocauli TaxID=3134136 RepID=A0ABU9W6E2_9MICO